ncbi:hypothetical protein BC829DRAFT_255892 [Chytridium lagenaria]|nr:hypothetical protein BC829DRAFT_255892 [Chytridium lagenaria]
MHDSLKSQIEIFAHEIFPSSSAQLKYYALFCDEWESVLNDIQKELEGTDKKSGLQEELQAANESVSLLAAELSEALKTPFVTEEMSASTRSKLIRNMIYSAAGSARSLMLLESEAVSDLTVHPIEVLAARVEREDVPVIQGMRHRLDELIDFFASRAYRPRYFRP